MRETPQSVSVITQESLRARQVVDFTHRADADFTGPLNDAKSVRGRVIAVYWHNVGTALKKPDHPQALGQYLALIREEASGDWLEFARTTLSKTSVADEAKALIGYGLAKYHDRRNEFAEAAIAGTTANAARRRVAGPLNRDRLQARVDGLIETYTPEFFANRRRFGAGTDQPIFIVGLPRSGTTLCEQILSSHPMIHGAGELPDLARLSSRVMDGTDLPPWRAAAQLTESKSLDQKPFATAHRRAPSGSQVRQPIYSKSVGKWQRYAPHLAELSGAFPPE